MKHSAQFAITRPRTLIVMSLTLAIVVGGVVEPFLRTSLARPTAPTRDDQQIAKAVSFYLRRSHLSGRSLDDEVGQRAMKSFLRTLDPMKLYFYQNDVDEFLAAQNSIDDTVVRGDLTLAKQVFDRFLKRVDERVSQIQTILDMEHRFDVDEEMIRDPDAAKYPKNEDEAYERWRKRIKYDILDLTADEELEPEEVVDRLGRRYTSFAKRMEQTNNDDLSEMYLSAISYAFDPHSAYMSPSTLKNFFILMSLELEGIGASLTVEDGYTVIKEIIPGGAADRDGRLKYDDKIIGVGQGSQGEIVDVVDMRLNDVVQLIRGKAETVVRLEVLAADGSGRQVYNIERARIELKDKEARSEIIEWGMQTDSKPRKVGVIDLPSFYSDMQGAEEDNPNAKSTARDVERLLGEFKGKGVELVVMDLRRNGGGSLVEAVDTTGLFIDVGPVVQVKGSDGLVKAQPDTRRGVAWDGPLVVLTSKFSASASEIFAGAMQDYGRGIVVGDKATHGKGTVQQLFDLGRPLFRPQEFGALKLTIQQFYLPNGESTQSRGVIADVNLPSITEQFPVSESDLDYALPFGKVAPTKHDVYGMTSEAVIDILRKNSKERREDSEDFQKELERIERYVEQKDRTTRTLNREKFIAERRQLNAEKEEEKLLDESQSSDRPVFDIEDYYNAEVLNIAVDYLDLLKDGRVAVNIKKR